MLSNYMYTTCKQRQYRLHLPVYRSRKTRYYWGHFFNYLIMSIIDNNLLLFFVKS